MIVPLFSSPSIDTLVLGIHQFVEVRTLEFCLWLEACQNSLDGHCLLAEDNKDHLGTHSTQGMDPSSERNDCAIVFYNCMSIRNAGESSIERERTLEV